MAEIEGRSWRKEEMWERFELLPEKFEMISGELLLSDEERENLLGVLLELVGADRTVQLGKPEVWRAAVGKLPA
jgi:hypothetical protein